MNARIAPPPIWPGPKTLNGCTVTAGSAELVVVGVRHVLAGELRDGVRPARLADRADRRDLALLDAERVRAEDLARREVDEALDACRASRAPPRARCRCRSRSRASSAPGSRAPCRRPAIAAQWTMCVAPRASSVTRVERRGRRPAWNVKFGCSASGGAARARRGAGCRARRPRSRRRAGARASCR